MSAERVAETHPERPTRFETILVLSNQRSRKQRLKFARFVTAQLAGCLTVEQYEAAYRRLLGELLS